MTGISHLACELPDLTWSVLYVTWFYLASESPGSWMALYGLSVLMCR